MSRGREVNGTPAGGPTQAIRCSSLFANGVLWVVTQTPAHRGECENSSSGLSETRPMDYKRFPLTNSSKIIIIIIIIIIFFFFFFEEGVEGNLL